MYIIDLIKLKNASKGTGKYFLLGFILVFFDQLTKFYFTEKYFDFGFFAFSYVKNYGISFGLFQGISNLIIIVSFLALGFLFYTRHEFKKHPVLLTLIVSGIIGNLIDRIFLGYVVDFINFKIWPVFNLADSFLVIGIILFIILSFQKSSKSSKRSK